MITYAFPILEIDRLPMASLSGASTGIAKAMGLNPVEAWTFFQASFQMLKSGFQ